MTLPEVTTETDLPAMSSMLDLRGVNVHVWSAQELTEMLRHQLSAPLQLSLGTLSAEVSHQIKEAGVGPLLTLDQLLKNAHPPLELLKLVKRFAKMCRRDRENPLPSEIVMLLYYASIAAALARLDQAISDLGPASLTRGMSWLAEQDWLTDDVRALLREGLARVQVHPVTREQEGTS
jgi:hypothetical protein